MEGPDEGAEAVFSRFYADRIAGKLLNDAPRIKRVIEAWQRKDASAFMSRLQKNEDLKSIVLNETPWVMEAKSEAERKKRIATLFDLNRMQRRSEKAVEKLSEVQGADGGWSWFPGMRSDRYITQHIVAGMGHLSSMGIELEEKDPRLPGMIEKALEFMDKRVVQEYKQVRGSDPDFKENDHLSHTAIQYLYARSYFPDMKMNQETEQAFDYFLDQAADHWLEKGVYMEGMLALAAHRYDRENLAGDIMKSLEERALRDPKKGMYWKNAASSYHWYEAPIERHALMILAFDEIKGDMEAVKELQVWLLRQKQTQDWGTSKATARACYALLAKGDRTMEKREVPTFEVGGEKVDPQEGAGADIEAGTGHFRTSWHGSEVRPGMGDVTLQKKDSGLSWGAMYWQYFQDLDKVSSSDDGSPLSLKKELYRVKKTETGESLHRIEKGDTLELGDRIQVRMELRVDRKMEYLHLKDLRGAGLEPVGTRSGYRYQDGLGYYCSIRDASMNYFFDRVTPGTYVLEYPLRVASKGDMSSGTATIQCMYAPEFRAHSEGVRLRIE